MKRVVVLPSILAVALVARWVKRRWAVIAVTGSSMMPTYHQGDRVLARQRPKRVAVGDVVVLKAPKLDGDLRGDRRWIVKRVAAVGGDRVPDEASGAVRAGEIVPPRHLMVLGDNRDASADSRYYGYLSADRVFARALRRL